MPVKVKVQTAQPLAAGLFGRSVVVGTPVVRAKVAKRPVKRVVQPTPRAAVVVEQPRAIHAAPTLASVTVIEQPTAVTHKPAQSIAAADRLEASRRRALYVASTMTRSTNPAYVECRDKIIAVANDPEIKRVIGEMRSVDVPANRVQALYAQIDAIVDSQRATACAVYQSEQQRKSQAREVSRLHDQIEEALRDQSYLGPLRITDDGNGSYVKSGYGRILS